MNDKRIIKLIKKISFYNDGYFMDLVE